MLIEPVCILDVSRRSVDVQAHSFRRRLVVVAVDLALPNVVGIYLTPTHRAVLIELLGLPCALPAFAGTDGYKGGVELWYT